MKSKFILASFLSACALTRVASATPPTTGLSSSGTMGVTCTVVGSINLTFATDASGMAVTGTTTATASLPIGSVQMYGGTVPSKVTKALVSTTSFSLTTPFDVEVDLANSASPTYTLTATLTTADLTNTWTLGGMDLGTGGAQTLTSTGAYGTPTSYTLVISIPATEAAFSLTNSIAFAASSN